MSRYIDADKLTFSRVRIIHPDGTAGGWNAVVMSSVINNAPTADVVEVRHGEWHSYEGYCECSLCHHQYVNTSLYCPNCGAKMDGDRREG